MDKKRNEECPACGENMVDTGEVKMNEEFRREVRVYLCPSCGVKRGIYYAGNKREQK
jgi:predicted RNA-binding Zn-ribbon protein involved in translation (DUF1610 family)